MKVIYIKENVYNTSEYKEILYKSNRPYLMLLIKIDNTQWTIPFRSNIKHNNKLILPNNKNGGLDYSKSIVLKNNDFISETPAIIDNVKYKYIKENIDIIYMDMKKYIDLYKYSFSNKHIKRYNDFCEKSTLQYFHCELNIEDK